MNKITHFVYITILILCIGFVGCKYSQIEKIENKIGDVGYIIICDKGICQGNIDKTIDSHRMLCFNAGFTKFVNSEVKDVDGIYCTIRTTAKSINDSVSECKVCPYSQIELLQLQLDIANDMLEQLTNKVTNVHKFSIED